MKTIKLTIIGILLSTTSFSQLIWNFDTPDPDKITDSIRYLISDDRIYELNESSKILNKQKSSDFLITLDTNQVLTLNMYDNCRICEVNGTRFMIVFGRKGEISKGYFKSKPRHFMIYGDVVSRVYVSKPIENE